MMKVEKLEHVMVVMEMSNDSLVEMVMMVHDLHACDVSCICISAIKGNKYGGCWMMNFK